jgi:putative colanic acid biosynthesis acetyltransferase WcaF
MHKVDLSSYQNPEYNPGAGILKRVLWMIFSSLFFQSYLLPVSSPKRFLLRVFGARIGKKVIIKPAVLIKHPWYLSVGDYTWIGEKVWVDNLVPVEIGDNVCISQGAMLLTGNHNYKSPGFDLIMKGIRIDNGSWIGAKAVVCPGVECGFQSVLTVGSVATRNLEPNQIYTGNPAQQVRKRELK